MTKEVYERVDAGVAHGQPVGAEPEDVDVLEAKENNRESEICKRYSIFNCTC